LAFACGATRSGDLVGDADGRGLLVREGEAVGVASGEMSADGAGLGVNWAAGVAVAAISNSYLPSSQIFPMFAAFISISIAALFGFAGAAGNSIRLPFRKSLAEPVSDFE